MGEHKKRLQLQLPAEQIKELKIMGAELGCSMTRIISRGISSSLDDYYRRRKDDKKDRNKGNSGSNEDATV